MPANTSWASSITHRSKRRRRQSGGSRPRLPASFASDEEHSGAGERRRPSRLLLRLPRFRTACRAPCCHCPSSACGTMMRIRCAPSASSCEMTSPASIVFPRPTSSARMQPPSRNAPKRKHHGVDLVRIGVDAAAGAATPLDAGCSRRPKADEVLGKVAPVDRVRRAFQVVIRLLGSRVRCRYSGVSASIVHVIATLVPRSL